MLDLLTSATVSVRRVPPAHNCPACTPSRRVWGTNHSKGERGSSRLYRGGGFLARLCCQSQALMEADPHRDKLILQMTGYSLHTVTAPLSLLCKNETKRVQWCQLEEFCSCLYQQRWRETCDFFFPSKKPCSFPLQRNFWNSENMPNFGFNYICPWKYFLDNLCCWLHTKQKFMLSKVYVPIQIVHCSNSHRKWSLCIFFVFLFYNKRKTLIVVKKQWWIIF